jgi:hypothetical protein
MIQPFIYVNLFDVNSIKSDLFLFDGVTYERTLHLAWCGVLLRGINGKGAAGEAAQRIFGYGVGLD